MKPKEVDHPESSQPKYIAPTVLDGFIQPGFLPKVFTAFFMKDCIVFVKTGSINTDTAGSIRASMGGYTGDALILGALGSIVDARSRKKRIEKAASVASLEPEQMVAAHKRNYMIPYNTIRQVTFKGPNFAGELRIVIEAGATNKYRINNQSKSSALYYEKVFNEFLPGRISKK